LDRVDFTVHGEVRVKFKVFSAALAPAFAFALCAPAIFGQSSATFGEVIQLGVTPSDVVLDQSRQKLYFVNPSANRVDIYDYAAKAVSGYFLVGTNPLGAAISMDNAFLYVANHDSSTLSVIDLASGGIESIGLPAKPQGVAVGADGRALIATDGTGTSSTINTLLIFDGLQDPSSQVLSVPFPPTPPTPPALQPLQARATTQFNAKLQRTPDGKYIVGVSSITNNTNTAVYVYETASGTVLLTRASVGQSSTLSVSPDGATFMAGFTLYDIATLNVLGQQNTANAPFTWAAANTSFSTNFNVGGSVFTPDGRTLYSAFNTAANTNPAPPPQASTLLIADPRNLAIRMGINLPESVMSKIVITSDGNDAWALSSSGAVHIPLSTLFDYPILIPETTTVFLAQDDCNPGVAQVTIKINNVGGGKLTFAVPSTIQFGAAAVAVNASTGVAPGTITFTMDPGRSAAVRTPGTNLYTGAGTNNIGSAVNITLVSQDAINVLPTIRVFMNYRDSTMRGIIYPVATVPNTNAGVQEGLQDILLDESRSRVYITNSGYNRIEVFDTVKKQFLAPIPVGQLPHQMAMGLDGSTLYVANTGGESVQSVDLDQQQVTGSIFFPPFPRSGNTSPTAVAGMAMGLSGLQMVMNNGTLWKVVNNQALPRTGTAITGVNAQGAQTAITAPRTMLGSADGSSIILLGGNGSAYSYDGLADAYTSTSRLFGATPVPGIPGGGTAIIGYYGPLGAAANANFLLANGLVLNRSLTVIGGAASPGQITITPGIGGPGGGGGFPTIGVSSSGLRNIAAGAAVGATNFVRMSTAVRTNLTAATSDDVHTILEAVDTRTGAAALAARMPENPIASAFGTTRVNTTPRQMVVGSDGTVYALTLSGLSVVPLAQATSATQPQIAATRGVVNADGSAILKPGSFITVNGTSLASAATADTLPPPTVLGGSCVLVGGVAIPLITTAPGQIGAQLPANIRTGANVLQVRSLSMAQQSSAVIVNIQKP
jgi:YVTN family beta-propeller protein